MSDYEDKEPVGVHLCSPTHSELFSDCCGVVITVRDERCPACWKRLISKERRWVVALGKQRKGDFGKF